MKKKLSFALLCGVAIAAMSIAAAFAWPKSREFDRATRTSVTQPTEDSTVCSIPATLEGKRVYFGEGGFETNVYGPTALAVGPDGTFWITDTINQRLLKVSRGCMTS